MQYITSVTQKGQITLPSALRKKLHITAYSRVVLQLSPNQQAITVEATEDILDLAGTFVPVANKDKTALDAREAMEDEYQRI